MIPAQPEATPAIISIPHAPHKRPLAIQDAGLVRYADALILQQHLIDARKHGNGVDTLLFLEHPHVVTMGRNGSEQNILASSDVLARTGIDYFETNRGGDVTYHGPGQLVGYPILDLREWRRDVHAYFQGVEQALIDALAEFGICAERIPERGFEGVWVKGEKIAAIGIHISRWITSHGFALNIDTRSRLFQIHCSVWFNKAGYFAAPIGLRSRPDRSDESCRRGLRADF